MLREFQFGVHRIIVIVNNDIATSGKRPRVENFRAPDEINTRGFVNVTSNAQVWLMNFDEAVANSSAILFIWPIALWTSPKDTIFMRAQFG